VRERIERDFASGIRAGVGGTPWVFAGGRAIQGDVVAQLGSPRARLAQRASAVLLALAALRRSRVMLVLDLPAVLPGSWSLVRLASPPSPGKPLFATTPEVSGH